MKINGYLVEISIKNLSNMIIELSGDSLHWWLNHKNRIYGTETGGVGRGWLMWSVFSEKCCSSSLPNSVKVERFLLIYAKQCTLLDLVEVYEFLYMIAIHQSSAIVDHFKSDIIKLCWLLLVHENYTFSYFREQPKCALVLWQLYIEIRD